jgi:hypothetical protein
MNARTAVSPVENDDSIALAEGFARRIGALSKRMRNEPRATRWARRAAFAVSRATTQGHVCVSLAALAGRYGESADAVRAALLASGVVCDGSQDAADLLPLVIDRERRIYLARYFDYERRLAQALVARVKTPFETIDADASRQRVGRYFAGERDGIDWQRVAALVALSGRLTIVSGGPGTGKTTTPGFALRSPRPLARRRSACRKRLSNVPAACRRNWRRVFRAPRSRCNACWERCPAGGSSIIATIPCRST